MYLFSPLNTQKKYENNQPCTLQTAVSAKKRQIHVTGSFTRYFDLVKYVWKAFSNEIK